MTTLGLDSIRYSAPELRSDPYPYYRLLREQAPVFREPESGHYLVSRFDDVLRIFADPSGFSNVDHIRRPVVRGTLDVPGQGHGVAITQDDEPYHGFIRRLVNRAFTPRMVDALEPFIRAVVEEQLDSVRGDTFDGASTLAVPVPIRVIAHVLGVPDRDAPAFKRWSDAVVADPSIPMEVRNAETAQFREYFRAVLAERRTSPRDDMVSKLLSAQQDLGETLPDDEILAICHVLLVAGNETTTGLISSMLNLLAHRPALWERLRADRSLIEVTVEESLRFESPVQSLGRRTVDDTTIADVVIPADAQVRILLASANRDERVFTDGDTFSLDRPMHELRRHLGFGHGIHFCLGAPLTRAEASIALEMMLDRFRAIEPARPALLAPAGAFSTRTFASVPLRTVAA